MNNLSNTICYSAVIPVYNSEKLVGSTVDRTAAFFESQGWAYEIILINDGSPDNSWQVIEQKALENPCVVAINLLKNYGQHTALYCGFQHSKGDYVITLDDDLQNPPEEIVHLVAKVTEGYDLVFGRFHKKEHDSYRRWGSRLIGYINEKIFDKPDDLVLSNFRIIRRDVIDRICAYQTNYPYIPGLALMFATNPANTWVTHQKRQIGNSNYNFIKILELVMRILFNYSSYPLRFVSAIGLIVAFLSFVLGIYYLIRATFIGTTVPGWATLVVLLSFFNGMSLLLMSMLGEYIIRLLNQFSSTKSYYVKEVVRNHE
jgi:polyisoprenyl-phosphate glycosyltransferase